MNRREPQQARSRRKVEDILAAARQLLEEDGPAQFTTNRVAAAAGVGVGSLYEYFPNKEAIADRLIERLAEEEASLVLSRLVQIADLPPRESVEAVVATVYELYRRNHRIYRSLWSLSETPRSIGHRPGERSIMAAIQARLEPLAEELGIDNPELASFTAFHIVESLCEQMAAHGEERWSPEQCAAEIARVVCRYLGLPDH